MARKVGEIAIAPYASEAYLERRGVPDIAQGLAGHDVIGYADAAAKWPEARWLAEAAPGARMAARCNSLLSVVAATAGGLGVGVMPCLRGDREPGLRRVAPVVASLRRDIWLVVHADLQHNARVRATLHFLAELIQRERPLLSGEGRSSRPQGRRSP